LDPIKPCRSVGIGDHARGAGAIGRYEPEAAIQPWATRVQAQAFLQVILACEHGFPSHCSRNTSGKGAKCGDFQVAVGIIGISARQVLLKVVHAVAIGISPGINAGVPEIDQLPCDGQPVGIHQALINRVSLDEGDRIAEDDPAAVGAINGTSNDAGAQIHFGRAGVFEVDPADIGAISIAAEVAHAVLIDAEVEVMLISRENFVLFTPMLHEVAAGDLYPGDIVNPLRRILRHVRCVEAEVQSIDLDARKVRCLGGLASVELNFEFDHLLVALGSETNYFDLPGVGDWAITIKGLIDAALLRNRVIAFLEEATLQNNDADRRRLLTFVTAGGGFSGVETTGALNDFVRDAVRHFPALSEDLIRVVVVHPGASLLPELGEELGNYAELKLRHCKVEVIKGTRVAGYDGSVVKLSDGASIPAETLLWTAGVKPSPVIDPLRVKTEKGRILVNEFLAVPGFSGLWAAGDAAAVPDGNTGKFHPPTAQHGLREGRAAARNIEATVLGCPSKPFTFKTQGQLGTIGRRRGVAIVFGIKFFGFIAWWLWRTIYLAKLPRLAKKLRVMLGWTLDLFFGREIEQTVTLRDTEQVTQRLQRIRQRQKVATYSC
jgi:NADH dehydrogenase